MREQIRSLKKGLTHIFFYSAILPVSGLAISLSCNAQEKHPSTEQNFSQPSVEMIKLKKEIATVNNDFMQALIKGDPAAVANCYTSDARFMVPNKSTIVNREAIQADFSGMVKSGATMQLTTIDLWGNNGSLTEEGLYTVTVKNGQQVDKGKYLALWKKENGSWKIFRECYNSDLPSRPAN